MYTSIVCILPPPPPVWVYMQTSNVGPFLGAPDSSRIDFHIFISTTEAHLATVISPLYSNSRCRFEAKRMTREVPSWTGSVPLKSALSIVFE